MIKIKLICKGAITGLLIFSLKEVTERYNSTGSLLEPMTYALIGIAAEIFITFFNSSGKNGTSDR